MRRKRRYKSPMRSRESGAEGLEDWQPVSSVYSIRTSALFVEVEMFVTDDEEIVGGSWLDGVATNARVVLPTQPSLSIISSCPS